MKKRRNRPNKHSVHRMNDTNEDDRDKDGNDLGIIVITYLSQQNLFGLGDRLR